MGNNSIQLLIPIVWLYFGFFTLKYVNKRLTQETAWHPWLNLISLFLGPVVWLLIILSRLIHQSLPRIRALFPAKKSKIPVKNIELLDSTGAPLADTQWASNNPALTIKLNNLLAEAIRQQAIELDFEPSQNNTIAVFFKTATNLKLVRKMNLKPGIAMVDALMTAAKLDLSEKNRAQKGILTAKLPLGTIRFLISTTILPSGEKLTVRLFYSWCETSGINAFNLSNDENAAILNLLKKPSGLILISGPPQSGRTTLMYSLMKAIDGNLKIVFSVEKLVEQTISNICQLEYGEKTVDEQLKLIETALQQTPDLLFIDELSNEKILKTVLHAAQKLLVVAVIPNGELHTIIRRSFEFGISPAALAKVLLLLLSIRQVRQLCFCKQKGTLSPEMQDYFKKFNLNCTNIHAPKGCRHCNGTGYNGLLPVINMVQLSSHLRDLLNTDGIPLDLISQKLAAERDDSKLVYHCLKLVSNGQTSEDEIRRIVLTPE